MFHFSLLLDGDESISKMKKSFKNKYPCGSRIILIILFCNCKLVIFLFRSLLIMNELLQLFSIFETKLWLNIIITLVITAIALTCSKQRMDQNSPMLNKCYLEWNAKMSGYTLLVHIDRQTFIFTFYGTKKCSCINDNATVPVP